MSVPPGKIKEVSSTANPLVKAIKGLVLKKNRDSEGTFLAEGQKLVTDAIERDWAVRTLVHAKNALHDDRHRDQVQALAATVHARGGNILIVGDKVLTSITRRDNAQAVLAVVEQKTMPVGKIDPKSGDCWLALDRVRDPGNLGTAIRTADALGAKGVMLVGETTDPFGLEAVRATMGSLFHVPLVRATVPEFLKLANQWPGQIVGTHLRGAMDHRTIDYSSKPQIILMGNEQQGLTEELSGACHKLARISMDGAADSLNLAVATGIMLFEARRHALSET